MTVYLLNLFSIPLYALLFYFAGIDNRKKNRILCGLAGLQLFLTAALRATTVGGDLENYIPAFLTISQIPWSELWMYPWEYGYVLADSHGILYYFAFHVTAILSDCLCVE